MLKKGVQLGLQMGVIRPKSEVDADQKASAESKKKRKAKAERRKRLTLLRGSRRYRDVT